jgi:hypothetical protein
MPDERIETEPYEPPTIHERVPISLPLIGQVSANLSAAFRP